jgi:hypothetical protein
MMRRSDRDEGVEEPSASPDHSTSLLTELNATGPRSPMSGAATIISTVPMDAAIMVTADITSGSIPLRITLRM